jgi:hypothetical protein
LSGALPARCTISLYPGNSFSVPTVDDAVVNGTRSIAVVCVATTGVTARASITVLDNDVAPPPPSEPSWVQCAVEGGVCTISGTAAVRYGAGSSWATKTVTDRSIAIMRVHPAWGVVKVCQTIGSVVSPPPPPPPPPPPSSGSITYGSIVTAVYACQGGLIPDLLVVGTDYKVVGLSVTRPAPGLDAPPGTKADGVILNPVVDDGVHRGDGYEGLWVPLQCVVLK